MSRTVRPLPNLSGDDAADYLKKQGLYSSLNDAVTAARYSINPLRHGPSTLKKSFKASNPGHAFATYFDSDGIRLVSNTTKNKWQIDMNLEGYGFGEDVVKVRSGGMEIQKDKNRIEIKMSVIRNPKLKIQNSIPEITGWYENSANGLEQGWTISERLPKNSADEQLRLVLKLGGDLKAKLAEDGQAVIFTKRNDEAVLRYDKLESWDADGKELASRMELVKNTLSIVVDDRDANYPITIDPFFTQTKKLNASDGASGDQFGFSVGISGDMAVVGAFLDDDPPSNSGSAYIFERNTGSGDNWGEVKKLTASDAAGFDQFGISVAISGDTVIIGAHYNDDVPSNSGSAYIFERNRGGANNWGEVKKLLASDAGASDQFGNSVSISGDTAVIGSRRSGGPNGTGAAYIYERNTGGADNWGQVRKLTASDAGISDEFGLSVSISADTAIIGAAYNFGVGYQSGAAYIFERNTGGANNWGQVKKLTASDAAASDNFGYSAAISGDTAIVGSRNDDDGGNNSGSAYIFERNTGGANNWGEVNKISSSDAAADDSFGHSVSISVDTVIVGAVGNDDAGSSSGSAYIFERNTGGANNWGEIQKLTASDAASTDLFGQSVSISNGTTIVGANGDDDGGSTSGSAYVFTNQFNNWQETSKTLASDGTTNDNLGISLSISGDTAIVGAYFNDDAGPNSGSAYIFKRNAGGANNWGEAKKLTAADAAPDDQFGQSVAISGDTAIVGTNLNDDVGTNSGSAYVFERNQGGADNWGEVKKLTASDAAADDEFGTAVGISGDTAIVGAPLNDDIPNNSGAAYIFERNQGGLNNWGEMKKLIPADPGGGDHFGQSVSISGDTAIVGAYLDDDPVMPLSSLSFGEITTEQGSANIFERNTGGADNWGEVKKLAASDNAGSDFFGWSVSISGETAIVGAYQNDDDGFDSGSVYIFERNTGGLNNWGEVKKLTASDAAADDEFGWAVSISGDTAIVGARGNADGGSFSGSVYIFERNAGGADNWGEINKRNASDAAVFDQFGFSVAISEDNAIVGSPFVDISALGDSPGRNRKDQKFDFSGSTKLDSQNLVGADQGAVYVYSAMAAPSAAAAAVSGRVVSTNNRGLGRVIVSLTDLEGDIRMTTTNHFGYFNFEDVASGKTYVLGVVSKQYVFSQNTIVVNVDDTISGIRFIGHPR